MALAGLYGKPEDTVVAELGDLVRNQLIECEQLGVELRFGTEVTDDLVDRLAPDVVVVATGSEPNRPWWAPPPPPLEITVATASITCMNRSVKSELP